jgi:hypothetical protein
MRADRLIGIALILSTALVWALYALDVDSPVRVAVAIAYLLVAPGLAVLSLLDLAQRWAMAVLSIALSLGIATVVATALLLAHLWTPGRALAIVGCITLLAAGARLVIPTGLPVPVASTVPGLERREDGS